MRGTKIGLGVMAVAFAGLAAFFLYAAGLGIVIQTANLVLFHVQEMDIALGTGAALASVICLAALAIVHAIDVRR